MFSGWEEYKKSFGKTYDDIDEELNRIEIFQQSQKRIKAHNALYKKGKESYSLCVNDFSDWTEKEFQNINGIDYTELPFVSDDDDDDEEEGDIELGAGESDNDYKDWRDDNAVTPVKHQGKCASCWAFSAAAALESHFIIKKRSTKLLSEQQLIDCSRHLGNNGCNKGSYTKAFTYTQSDGIIGENEYPKYEQKDNQCRVTRETVGTLKNQQYMNITKKNEDMMKETVRNIGPVSVSIHANTNFQMLGPHGVFYDTDCSKKPNHAVLVVGYGFDKKKNLDYWLIKNSHGIKWGNQGFARLARNKNNHCGIASYPAYPIV